MTAKILGRREHLNYGEGREKGRRDYIQEAWHRLTQQARATDWPDWKSPLTKGEKLAP